jgi:leucyl aminopeptidase
MDVTATTAGPFETDADTVAIGLFEGKGIPHDPPGKPLGALVTSGEARSELARVAVTHAEGKRVIVVGLGSRDDFDPERARAAAAAVLRRAREFGSKALCWEAPHKIDERTVGALVEGTLLRSYRFDRYKSATPAGVERLIISAHHDIAEPVRAAALVAAAQNRARDLGNTPANELTPTALADYAVAAARRLKKLKVTVLDEDAIVAAGMGAFAAVSQGSAQPAKLIRFDYTGAKGPALGLVGKAVTFDTGGISLKPAGKMHEMKFDMLGGAAVIEAIRAIAELELPIHVLGVVGATENMPSGRAVKPGDIVSALDGTTIEVNNTDAEGRLVLADCITYAIREGAEKLVDLATLTGGVVVALGNVYAGLMSNDDAWAGEVDAAASATGELTWRLPLHEAYAEMVKGRYAQLTNMTDRREASSIAGAEFLHHFVGETPWVHLDIAGTAYDVRRPYIGDKGASGYGVRLLVELAQRSIEITK